MASSSTSSNTSNDAGSGTTDPEADADDVVDDESAAKVAVGIGHDDDDRSDLVPPSFEELPPRRGTILEIHSLKSRSDLNGTLAEFLNVVSANGRYAVKTSSSKKTTNDKKDECIAIMPENCHRPKMLPLEIRRKLVMEFDDRRHSNESSSSSSRDDAPPPFSSSSSLDCLEKWVVNYALKTDPCFVLGHLFLGDQQVYQESRGSLSSSLLSFQRQRFKAAIPHYRRAVANMYAYDFDLLPETKKSRANVIADNTSVTMMMKLAALLGQLAVLEERPLPAEARELFQSVHSKQPNHMHATFGVAEALWEDIFGTPLPTISHHIPIPSDVERMKEPVELYFQVLAAPNVAPHVNGDLDPVHRAAMIRKSQQEIRHYLGVVSRTYMIGIGGTVGVPFGKTSKVESCRHIIHIADHLLDLSKSPSSTSTSSPQPRPLEMDPIIRSAVLTFKGTALGHLSLIVAEDQRQETPRQTLSMHVQNAHAHAVADPQLWQQMEECFRQARQVGSNINDGNGGSNRSRDFEHYRQQDADVNLSFIIYQHACLVEKRGDVLMMICDDCNPTDTIITPTELEQQAKVSFEKARDLLMESNRISQDSGTSQSLSRVSAKLNPNLRCRVNRITGDVEAMAITNNAFIRQ